MATKKRRRNQVDEMIDTATVTPNSDVTAKTKRRYRLMRRAVTLSPFMTLLCALFAFVAVGVLVQTLQARTDEPTGISATQTGKTQAESSLQSWLDNDDSVFAGSTITSWDGVSNPESVDEAEGEIGYQLMTHDFTVRSQEGTYYRASVRIAYTPTKGVKVMAAPTIAPLAPTAVSDWEPTEPSEGWKHVSASSSSTDAITSWAGALTSSPKELKLATRDEDSSHVYSILGGFTVSEATIVSAWSPQDRQGAVDPSTLVASVNVELTPAETEEGDEAATTVQYDVLVRGADTAAPYVTAWGPVGSGTKLSDYENATSLDGAVDESTPEPIQPSDGGGESPSSDESAMPTEGDK